MYNYKWKQNVTIWGEKYQHKSDDRFFVCVLNDFEA